MAVLKNSDIIKGSALMLFFEDDKTVAFATEHSLSISLETTDISTKSHGDFSATLPQRLTWSASASNLYSDVGIEEYYKRINSMSPVHIKFAKAQYVVDGATHDYEPYADTGGKAEKGIVNAANGAEDWQPGTIVAEGDALITSVEINASAGDNATLSIQFQGVGALESAYDKKEGE